MRLKERETERERKDAEGIEANGGREARGEWAFRAGKVKSPPPPVFLLLQS